MIAFKLPAVSFGAVSAIVTSVGLIFGFGAAGLSKATIIEGLLIVGLADNLTDSLSIHVYQESERLEGRAAFKATLGNFATRLLVSLSFVLVFQFSGASRVVVSLAWGILLLIGLTWLVARNRHAGVLAEILKHLAVAAVVIMVTQAIGTYVSIYVQ